MADPAAARPAELFVDVEDAAFYDDHRDHLRDSAPPDPADAATDEAIRGEVNESYLSRARSSRVPFNHLTGLIAAAQLDDGSPPATRVGYPALFEATCERGGRHWLDPMPLLREINETLRRYLAPREALGSVVTLLTRLARCGISPYAVLDYVVAPRLREDRNWRRWGTAHLPVIAAVADLI